MPPIGACTSLLGFMVCLVPWPLFLGIPRITRTVPVCLLLGRKKSLANAAASSASLAASFSSFTCNAHPCVAGLRSLHRSRFPYAASVIVGLAAQQAGRPDLIRSPKRVLAHLWEDSEL